MMKWYCSLFLMFLLSACWHGKKKGDVALDAMSLPGNVEAGRLLYNNSCKTCHGESAEGNRKFRAPALANTNDWYLYRQLMNYRNGIRGYDNHDTLAFQMAA